MSKILNHSLKFLIFFVIFFIIFNFRVSYVNGNSMDPTLKDNSLIVVDKFIFRLFDIQKGDILIVKVKDEEMIKRLAFIPGERFEEKGKIIELKKDELYILGDNPSESIDSRNYGPVKSKQIVGKLFLSF